MILSVDLRVNCQMVMETSSFLSPPVHLLQSFVLRSEVLTFGSGGMDILAGPLGLGAAYLDAVILGSACGQTHGRLGSDSIIDHPHFRPAVAVEKYLFLWMRYGSRFYFI